VEEPRPRRRPESQIDSTELNLADLLPEQLGDLKREANSVTGELLRLMGVSAEVEAQVDADGLRIAIESETDEALLIGRRGETRAALQQVINRILSKRTGVFTPVLVDVAGYWERRVESLTQDAYDLAERAISSGIKAQSEPLSPQERRVIHRALTNDDRVTTESVGRGLHKSVLVQPERTDPEA
jgi:spoIIIJ-associated protein